MKRKGPAEAWSIRIDGKVTEAMQMMDISKAELSERVGLGKETLKRKGTDRSLGTLDFLTVALIAEAAGYDLEFRRKPA